MDLSPAWKTANKRKPSFNALYKKSMTQHIDRKVKKVVRDPTPEQEEKKQVIFDHSIDLSQILVPYYME